MAPAQGSRRPGWQQVNEALAEAAIRIEAETTELSPNTRAEGLRYLGDLLAAGIVVCMEHSDPYRPRLGRMIEDTMKWGLDAPDCLYLYASVCGDCRYRLHGRLGSARHVDIQVNWGHYAEGDISRWGTVSSVNSDRLYVERDGRFELFLGGPQREPNWIPLAHNAQFLLIRQYFSDWNTERPADLAVERIAGPSARPDSADDALVADLERLCDWLSKGGALWREMSTGLLAMEPNTVFVNDPARSSERGGMRDQIYCLGNFRCRRDEAVIIELLPPRAKFWSVSLANRFWQSLDYATRHSSLNAAQAELDADGRLFAVIAHDDPGIANWLDPCAHDEGTLAIRFLACEDTLEPSIRSVSRSRLAAELPAHATRITPAQRTEILALRAAGVRRRFRP
jgi:hypothetical protein